MTEDFAPGLEPSSLDRWILEKHGLDTGDRTAVQAYQLARIQELIDYARSRSRLYGRLYQDLAPPTSLEAFANFPFTEASDLIERGQEFLCVSQSEIARIVSLQTSGTTQAPKRVYFTRDDLDLTLDFFQHGMKTLCGAGDRALILFPWQTPDSVGALLATALERLGLTVYCRQVEGAAELFSQTPLQVVCGPASWVVRAAELNPGQGVSSVLTSSETLTQAMRTFLGETWGTEVFDHYGMTETGLGGAVECRAHQGLHIRENDLYFEVVDQEGAPLPDGREGELVVTTLTRRGMPFIRYRTGDRGLITSEPCPCGSSIRRLLWARRMAETT